MAGVLVFGDWIDGRIAPLSLEVAAAGASVAQAFGEPLLGALIGDDLSKAQDFGGCATLYLVEGKQYRPYTAQACLAAAQAVIKASAPSVALFAHTLEAREWVPALSALLDTGLVMDCTALGTEGRDLVVTKPVFGGGVLGTFVVRGAPALATVRSGMFRPAVASSTAELVRLETAAPQAGRVTFLDETAAVAGGLRLKDAKVVVSGGRGVGGPKNWHFIEETAAALGAAVGCSRAVADSGWIPSWHQVGISGTSVTPELYLAVGISGAVQHLAGIGASSTVVAVNTDADAEIFTRAKYGVVGDCREVLPAFVDRLRQLKT
jgi:electron transfer flavoprotein alpha subunit